MTCRQRSLQREQRSASLRLEGRPLSFLLSPPILKVPAADCTRTAMSIVEARGTGTGTGAGQEQGL